MDSNAESNSVSSSPLHKAASSGGGGLSFSINSILNEQREAMLKAEHHQQHQPRAVSTKAAANGIGSNAKPKKGAKMAAPNASRSSAQASSKTETADAAVLLNSIGRVLSGEKKCAAKRRKKESTSGGDADDVPTQPLPPSKSSMPAAKRTKSQSLKANNANAIGRSASPSSGALHVTKRESVDLKVADVEDIVTARHPLLVDALFNDSPLVPSHQATEIAYDDDDDDNDDDENADANRIEERHSTAELSSDNGESEPEESSLSGACNSFVEHQEQHQHQHQLQQQIQKKQQQHHQHQQQAHSELSALQALMFSSVADQRPPTAPSGLGGTVSAGTGTFASSPIVQFQNMCQAYCLDPNSPALVSMMMMMLFNNSNSSSSSNMSNGVSHIGNISSNSSTSSSSSSSGGSMSRINSSNSSNALGSTQLNVDSNLSTLDDGKLFLKMLAQHQQQQQQQQQQHQQQQQQPSSCPSSVYNSWLSNWLTSMNSVSPLIAKSFASAGGLSSAVHNGNGIGSSTDNHILSSASMSHGSSGSGSGGEAISSNGANSNLTAHSLVGTESLLEIKSSAFFQKRMGHPYQNRNPPKRKKPRTSFNRPQIVELEKRFIKQKYLASSERSALAKMLKMTDAQVKTWFQNRRTKWRRQNAEEKEAERQATNKLLMSLKQQHQHHHHHHMTAAAAAAAAADFAENTRLANGQQHQQHQQHRQQLLDVSAASSHYLATQSRMAAASSVGLSTDSVSTGNLRNNNSSSVEAAISPGVSPRSPASSASSTLSSRSVSPASSSVSRSTSSSASSATATATAMSPRSSHSSSPPLATSSRASSAPLSSCAHEQLLAASAIAVSNYSLEKFDLSALKPESMSDSGNSNNASTHKNMTSNGDNPLSKLIMMDMALKAEEMASAAAISRTVSSASFSHSQSQNQSMSR